MRMVKNGIPKYTRMVKSNASIVNAKYVIKVVLLNIIINFKILISVFIIKYQNIIVQTRIFQITYNYMYTY